MSNLLIFLNIISFISSNQIISFNEFLNYGTANDISFAKENNINDWNDYTDYLQLQNPDIKNKGKGDGNGDSISKKISDIKQYLNDNFADYDWIRNDKECALTSDVSNNIPIEMQSTDFPGSEIKTAIKLAGVENKTSYGGCGPIAAMGIMDYFSRYLGYDEIISDPTDSNNRVFLATEILSHTYFSILGNTEGTLVWPMDYVNCFNTVISNHGLENIIKANEQHTLFGGEQTNYWNQIVENIDNGMPVTLFTGFGCGDGEFSQHYTNIYGYETWVGIPDNVNERITKNFIKARLNWNQSDEYYCNADILNCGQLGIVTYDVNYSNTYSFYDDDFAEEFVNDKGGGQYFFYNKDQQVTLSNGKTLETSRLRASHIEDKYLVLSPNRKDAGISYLDITFPNSVSKFSFTASMWSSLEGAISENLIMQYYDNGWKDHISINPYKLSTLKEKPDNFKVLFPKDTNRIRFYATHSNPSGDRNKGRICLDNFKVEYN